HVKIGYRTLKTAVATPIALFVADLLGITNVVSVAIFTILCIQPSRKKSVESAVQRVISSIIVMILSIVFFELLGYHFIVLSILLIVFIMLSVMLQIEQAIMSSTVVLLNIFSFGAVQVNFLKEQLLFTLIGVSMGLIVNLYMPHLNKAIKKIQINLEDNLKIVLNEISLYLKNGNLDWKWKELEQIQNTLDKAEELVKRDRAHYLFRELVSQEV